MITPPGRRLTTLLTAGLIILFPRALLRAQGQNPPLPRIESHPQAWILAWSDEFNGSAIDPSSWTFDTGGSGWGNNELENYTARADNAIVANGSLLIMAKKETLGSNAYTSARMKTQGLRTFMYGRVEARMKLPQGQGLWPAFWMLGQNITTVGWPACGEIDIMEHIDSVPLCYGTMHWDNNGHVQYGSTTACDVSQYHVYAVEWDASGISWYVDTVRYCTGNIANNINNTGAFHAPFFILLNFAVGGTWPGNPDGTTVFPDTMFVDYVRVYAPGVAAAPRGESGLPEAPVLLQNFPNPCNPSATLRFALPRKSTVNLTVFDLLGRDVRTLVNGDEEAGYHDVLFDGANLASGMYFYRLKAGGFIQTKELLLVR